MIEIREHKNYNLLGKTIKVQLSELKNPKLNEIKMITKRSR